MGYFVTGEVCQPVLDTGPGLVAAEALEYPHTAFSMCHYHLQTRRWHLDLGHQETRGGDPAAGMEVEG
eukprot:CAMPEP_0113322974 /NCGR_PEP_ID=MMETSP0010_2-20120614/15972_1 /TAXON_ID=216773 ORGANISM="Corethron hystrix, Strain 308" /NCGR_SAMPLE_ID=MMETSP0010_2 /ASSEMBLY_ACC=CAM_ASM_000155 /LENGTH=67 /DNA_ID=CAMNT_0000181671 /DNA_START=95 /DNA_END=298 /DNA_ORIENTATION=- /assembly_acc=CAM_ASM_000155